MQAQSSLSLSLSATLYSKSAISSDSQTRPDKVNAIPERLNAKATSIKYEQFTGLRPDLEKNFSHQMNFIVELQSAINTS